MDTGRIESFKQFARHLEYPMVIFEAESGNVLDMNYEAEVVLGGADVKLRLGLERTAAKTDVKQKLHEKKTVMWQRMSLFADDREYLVNGLVNETVSDGLVIYSLMFGQQADSSHDSLMMERILDQVQTVAVNMVKEDDGFRVSYISKNVNQYGYTREQFYEGVIEPIGLVCPEDTEWVEERIEAAARAHEKETALSCRVFTESNDLLPVRISVQYIYNDYGALSDMRLLIMDLGEEIKRNSENIYLNRALSKMKSVVLVKSYHAGKRTLRYISSNAGMLGMNADALLQGCKLTEDYIHAADRDMVIDTIYQAVANGVTDYTHAYRMMRDDGKMIWVLNEVMITRISDDEAEVSFLLTDITEKKEIEAELAAAREQVSVTEPGVQGAEPAPVRIDRSDEEMLEQFQLMTVALNRGTDYYTVVLDADGKLLTDPVGPDNEMGQFYDLFERPQFKEEFMRVLAQAKKQIAPQSVSFPVGQLQVHMVLAPFIFGDAAAAYWVLTSFAPDGMEQMEAVVEQQWRLVNAIAQCFYAEEQVQHEQKLRKLAELQLDREKRARRVIQDILDSIVTKGETGLREACQLAGRHLSVADIGLYKVSREGERAQVYYAWNRSGEDSAFFENMTLTAQEYRALRACMKDDGYVVADPSSTDPLLQEILQKTGVHTLLIRHITMGSGQQGYIVFADAGRNRQFEEKDISFMSVVSRVFEGMLVSNQEIFRERGVKELFIEAYDYIREPVFVRDNETGDIIFANKAMDKLFGYSLVGTPASEVVSDQMEHYRSIGGVKKRFIANKKVIKWQKYIKELDQIMNIVEIHMELFNDRDCNLYILKKSKSKI